MYVPEYNLVRGRQRDFGRLIKNSSQWPRLLLGVFLLANLAGTTVAQNQDSNSLSPEIVTTFDAWSFNSSEFDLPVSPIGAAGLDRLISVGNDIIQARDKSGGLLWESSLGDFFSPTAEPETAEGTVRLPRIVYDHFEDRFLVVADIRTVVADGDSRDESRLLLAVSRTSQPTSAAVEDWYFHVIDSTIIKFGVPHYANIPAIEVDEEAIYLATSLFSFDLREDGGTWVWIGDKGSGSGGFYDGGPGSFTNHNPIGSDSPFCKGGPINFVPALVHGPQGIGPGIGTFLIAYNGCTEHGLVGEEFLMIARVDDPLGTPDFVFDFINVGNIEDIGDDLGWPRPGAPQPEGVCDEFGELVIFHPRRVWDAVWRDGSLWIVTTIIPNSGQYRGQLTAHWFKLDTSEVVDSDSLTGLIKGPGEPDPGTSDQGDIGGGGEVDPLAFTFDPSVAVNSVGVACFSFSASSPSLFSGSYIAQRFPNDPPGVLRAPKTVRAGLDCFRDTSEVWGYLSGTSVDPADGNLFWSFNVYSDTATGDFSQFTTSWASCLGVECQSDSDCEDDGNVCTTEVCDGGFCSAVNNFETCNDDDECTDNDACDEGVCAGAPIPGCRDECETAADCPDDGNVCTSVTCEQRTCVPFNITDPCDDDDECTNGDTCSEGECVGTRIPECGPCDANLDTDGDGADDCSDPCLLDNPDDSDGDGICDSDDGCPEDPSKIRPGDCGCGLSDADRDLDGTQDCFDECPDDPNKIAPGTCGCRFSDMDADGNGIPDCQDQAPEEGSTDGSGDETADEPGDETGDDGNSLGGENDESQVPLDAASSILCPLVATGLTFFVLILAGWRPRR